MSSTADSPTSTPSDTTTAATGAVSQISIRFANFFTRHGKPGPALDIYDTPTGQAATPLFKDIAYGAVSAFAHPALPANELPSQAVINFYALPTGEDPVAKQSDSQGLGGIQDDGSHPQATSVLTADTGTLPTSEPLAGMSFSTQVETGDFNGDKGPLAPPPPAGKGEILVSTSPVIDMNLGLYLIDGSSCAPPINGDPNLPGVPYIFNSGTGAVLSDFAIFATAPGTRQVSVVAWKSSVTPTCAELQAKAKQGTISIAVAAGKQTLAYVYGTSANDLHLASAPVLP